MYEFYSTATEVIFVYRPEFGLGRWVRNELTGKGRVRLSKVFHFEAADLLHAPPADDEIEDHTYEFKFGTIAGSYIQISGKRFAIKNDVHVEAGIELKRKLFVAERDISIFGRLSDLLTHANPIVLGGEDVDAIPMAVFRQLLDRFPTTIEMNKYAGARVTTVLAQYVDGLKDARGRYESYLNKRLAGAAHLTPGFEEIKAFEIEKYVLIRDLITDALKTKQNVHEKEWQALMSSFLLFLFPKYIRVLQNVTLADYYSTPGKRTNRYIDMALVDANGNLDVIEIKRPFDDKILRKSPYRSNSIPTAELSGSIMQAEKYLFHLSKWGASGEAYLTEKYGSELPEGMTLRISNPKAIIILGRDDMGGAEMTGSQKLDFEVIKRKYANMMDIITYDDLLRRLNNTIAALSAPVAPLPPVTTVDAVATEPADGPV